jgi:two-component system, chemotaxis family, chemotaxis protein CheY
MIIFEEVAEVPVRVLVVDDAIAQRELIRSILERAEMEVCGEAGTGAEAVERYRDLWPDLVTMDLVMPHMSGTEAAAAIMKIDVNARIIAVSGLMQPSVMAEAQDVGMVGFIAKPLDADELVAEIEAIMSKPAF